MNFNTHSNLEGKHAILSPSSFRWIFDEPDQLIQRYRRLYATDIGTVLHYVARSLIENKIKLHKHDKKMIFLRLLENPGIPNDVAYSLEFDEIYDNFMRYVNDAILYRMTPEVVLYYSDRCFGTTDAIAYDDKDKFLRIHDYKSGTTPAHMEQLEIYAGLFCLEYKVNPRELATELRIYQGDEPVIFSPTSSELNDVVNAIINQNKILMEEEGLLR